VALEGDVGLPQAHLTGPQESGLVRAQGLAQGLAVVPEGVTRVEPGETLGVILLDEMGLGGTGPGY
jgi:molybdopterin biosynthesis enzyme